MKYGIGLSGKDIDREHINKETPEKPAVHGTPEQKGPAVDLFEEHIGLFELWPNTPSGELEKIPTTLDIVAIHGLGGHPYKTWTQKDKLWLRDFVPQTVPEARILTYGYNSAIAFSGSTSGIDEFARTLLERLRHKRRVYKNTNRPLLLVTHGLGGIVFKKALVISHERSSRYHDFSASVTGVMFMGVPHRGADFAFWSHALGRIANIPLLGALRTDLLNDLTPKSGFLRDLCDQFIERGKDLQIFSIYERKRIPGLPGLVVDKSSALLQLPNEISLSVDADHIKMVKFPKASCEAYLTVFDCLMELIDAARGKDDSRTLTY